MFPFSLNQTIGSSYPADPDDVLRTKKGLNRLGFYAVPKYGMTPWTDDELFAGLKNFQRDNGLAVDGIMKPGGPTQSLLWRRLSGRKDERDLTPTSFAPRSGLGKGEKNREEDVLGLRRSLAGLGFMPGSEAASKETLFDSPLEKAIKNLQGKHGLKEDGIIRPKGPTLEVLAKRLKNLVEGDDDDDDYIKPPPKPSPKPTPPQDPDKPKPDKPDEKNKEKCRQLAEDIRTTKLKVEAQESIVATTKGQVEGDREGLADAWLNFATLGFSEINTKKQQNVLGKIVKKTALPVQILDAIKRIKTAKQMLKNSEAQLAKDTEKLEGLKSKLGALEAEFAQNCGRG